MWWDSKTKKDGRYYYCTISGGYVVLGSRGDNLLEEHDSFHAALEDFLQGKLQEKVKEDLGEQVLKEVVDKVSNIIQQRNSKQTGAAPGGIS